MFLNASKLLKWWQKHLISKEFSDSFLKNEMHKQHDSTLKKKHETKTKWAKRKSSENEVNL